MIVENEKDLEGLKPFFLAVLYTALPI